MNRASAFRFLVRCLAPAARPDARREKLAEEIAAGRIGWERVIEIASEYWMTLALYRELGEKRLLPLLPSGLAEYFDSLHRASMARNLGILEHAGEVAGLLNKIGVEPMLLKGASHLAAGLYPDPAVRVMSDLDILVPDERALECRRLLISAGYRSSAARGDIRVEEMPHQEWPELWREGRTGVLEMHRIAEWSCMPGSGWLYPEARPVTLGGGRALVPSATSRLILSFAHPYVHHKLDTRPAMPLRDLYDATQLWGRHGEAIAWPKVIEAFAGEGRMEALRTACMMWFRLFGQSPPCAIGLPRGAWIYRQRCNLTVTMPRSELVLVRLTEHADLLRRAISRGPEGRRIRGEFFAPRILYRKLRTAAHLLVAGPTEGEWK